MVKTFSKKKAPVERVPFDFEVVRGGETEKIRFHATKSVDMAAVARITGGNTNAVGGMLRVIMKAIDDTDGTPLTWQPIPVQIARYGGGWMPESELPDLRVPSVNADGLVTGTADDDVDIVPGFRGPTGAYHPMSEAPLFLEESSGSSRRRWVHMINDDDDVTIDSEDITALFEWVVSLAAGRPTPPSS